MCSTHISPIYYSYTLVLYVFWLPGLIVLVKNNQREKNIMSSNLAFFVSNFHTDGFRPNVIGLLYVISILCGIAVIITKNPVVSVLYLIGLFFSISCYLMLLGINYLGLSYLLVYVGAVSILFLFILMLINVRVSEISSHTKNSIPLAIFTGIAFIFTVFGILPYDVSGSFISNYTYIKEAIFSVLNISANSGIKPIESIDETIYFVTSSSWDGNLSESTHITSIGNIMYTSYSMWLILTSLILLLAMIGTIVITVNFPVPAQKSEKPFDIKHPISIK